VVVSSAEHFVHCDNNGIGLFTVIKIQIKYLFPTASESFRGAKNILQLGICLCLSHDKWLNSYSCVV
jgi:hypothetical protein